MDEYEDRTRFVNRLLDLAAVVSRGRDTSHLYHDFEYAYNADRNVDRIERIFRSDRMPWSKLVRDDAYEILNGRTPNYFMLEAERIQLYRERRGIPKPAHNGPDGVSLADAAEELRSAIERWQSEQAEYGVVPDSYKHYASYEEQPYFYGTQEWINTAKAARFLAHYKCENCGARQVELHVHHETPLITAYDEAFRRNFNLALLKVLCRTCHMQFHSKNVRDLEYYFMLADQPSIQEYKEELQRLREWHDTMGTCRFCKDEISKRYPNE